MLAWLLPFFACGTQVAGLGGHTTCVVSSYISLALGSLPCFACCEDLKELFLSLTNIKAGEAVVCG